MTRPLRRRPGPLGALRLPLLLLSCACVPEYTLPECEVVTDCPACGGWRSCRDGLCFKFGGEVWDEALCAAAGWGCLTRTSTAASDGCCAGASLEAEQDADCDPLGPVVLDGAAGLSSPAVRGDTVYVTAVDAAGGMRLLVLEPGAEPAAKTLPGSRSAVAPMEPVVLGDGAALVSAGGGICRVSAEGALEWACDRGEAPVLHTEHEGGCPASDPTADDVTACPVFFSGWQSDQFATPRIVKKLTITAPSFEVSVGMPGGIPGSYKQPAKGTVPPYTSVAGGSPPMAPSVNVE